MSKLNAEVNMMFPVFARRLAFARRPGLKIMTTT